MKIKLANDEGLLIVKSDGTEIDILAGLPKYPIVLQKEPSNTGAVSGGGNLTSGSTVTVVATPDAYSDYTLFDGWYEGEEKVSNLKSYTFLVSGARTLVAKFVEPSAVQGIASIEPNLPWTTGTITMTESLDGYDITQCLKITTSYMPATIVAENDHYVVKLGNSKVGDLYVNGKIITISYYTSSAPSVTEVTWENT